MGKRIDIYHHKDKSKDSIEGTDISGFIPFLIICLILSIIIFDYVIFDGIIDDGYKLRLVFSLFDRIVIYFISLIALIFLVKILDKSIKEGW